MVEDRSISERRDKDKEGGGEEGQRAALGEGQVKATWSALMSARKISSSSSTSTLSHLLLKPVSSSSTLDERRDSLTQCRMQIRKIKVRPKKSAAAAPCAVEFAAMLACWASASDLSNTGACAESSRMLQDCLKQSVSPSLTEGGGRGLSSPLTRLLPFAGLEKSAGKVDDQLSAG